jgi:hypothetical protein
MKSPVLTQAAAGRRAGWAGLAMLLAAGAAGGLAPQVALPAARFAAVACLQPALGCLIFALIYRITGGQWGATLRRPFAAGIRLVPWLWPVLALVALCRAARPDLPLPAGSAPMPGPGALAIRAAIYEMILLGVCAAAVRPRFKPYAGPALIVLVFTGHFLAADAFFVLEPGWYSTGFPLVWLAICAASGLAVSLIAASGWSAISERALTSDRVQEPFADGPSAPGLPPEALAKEGGLAPPSRFPSGRPVAVDWGNLLLTSVVFSTYLVLMEFLIIWSANLPAEIAWFLRREHGAWPWLALLLGVVHLGFPFLLLLSRRWKESPRGVPIAAGIVAVAEILWALWLVLPPFANRGWGVAPFAIGFLAGGAAVWWSRYRVYFAREAIE